MHPKWVRGHAIGWRNGDGRVSAAPNSGGASGLSGGELAAVFSRRSALGAGVAVVGTAAFAANAPAAAAPGRAVPTVAGSTSDAAEGFDPSLPVRSQFAGLEGTVYQGASQWSVHRLVLERVADLPGGGDAEQRFALQFATDGGARDGLYRLQSHGRPDAVLYLVRVGGDDQALEAIIDRAEQTGAPA